MRKSTLAFALTFCFLTIHAQTTFKSKVTINGNTGNTPFNIASGLINGDAYPDILVATYFDETMEYYENNGDGTFPSTPVLISNTLQEIGGLKLVDLNSDGTLDILAAGYTNDKLVWFEGNGDGTFGAEQTISSSIAGANGLAVGTIDAGNTIDIAVTAYDGNEVVWFSNDGSGSFTGPNTIDNTIIAPGSVNLKDVDGDLDLDAFITNAQFAGSTDIAVLFRNDGNGTFTQDATDVTTGKNYIFNAFSANLDGDTNVDFLLSELHVTAGAGNFYWIEEDGVGGYTETAFTTSIGNPAAAQLHDLDNDTFLDIILSSGQANAGNDIVWFRNDGAGGYEGEAVIDNTQSQAFVFTVNDFDQDGDLDIASCAYNQDDLNYFENELITLSNPTVESISFGLWPNPTSKEIVISSPIEEEIDITIYDSTGRIVAFVRSYTNTSIDLSTLTAGLYVLQIDDYQTALKFVKQ